MDVVVVVYHVTHVRNGQNQLPQRDQVMYILCDKRKEVKTRKNQKGKEKNIKGCIVVLISDGEK